MEARQLKICGAIGGEGFSSRSLSPKMWNHVFTKKKMPATYLPFDVQPKNLATAIEGVRELGFIGVNVTNPHKEKIVDLLDSLSKEASSIGAVNTVKNTGGNLRGFNTDAIALEKLLRKSARGKKAVVLGAGGAARAALHALRGAGKITVVNRTPEKARKMVREMDSNATAVGLNALPKAILASQIVVNCTPIGMYVPGTPLPKKMLRRGLLVADFAYSLKGKTRLAREARQAGCKVVDGKSLLAMQASESFRTLFGKKASPGLFLEGLK